MALFNPKTFSGAHPDQRNNDMLAAVADWFEAKGLESIKKDWHDKVWNHSFVEFMKENQVLATLMTPDGYADDAAWNSRRNVEFAEMVGYYGVTYWYTFQVSMLGLGPIFNGDNEDVKHRAAQLLKDGAVFAFGLSEEEHGADIYSSSMQLIPQGDGTYVARGSKYYIGNGNEAALVSVFGKNSETGEYVFFVVDSKHEKYECVKNTVDQQSYVAEFHLHDYPITDADILCSGQKAWDDMLNTINYCKFNLGFGAIGLATHAMHEAITHAHNRILYGKPVTNFPHVRRLFTDAWLRLMAMKMFSYRATDYMRSASADDRRYLLFNPIVKMKVTMEGEKVVANLTDIIAAKAYEKEPFFEIASKEIVMCPKLEGTAHVNMGLINKFMKNYFFAQADMPDVPERMDNSDDTYLFNQGPTRGLSDVHFANYDDVYGKFDTPNIAIFKEQINGFKRLLAEAGPDKDQLRDTDLMLSVGELFTLVVYGQLILEKAAMEGTSEDVLNQMFDMFVRDFSIYATTVYGKAGTTDAQRKLLLNLIRAPRADSDQFDRIWNSEVVALSGAY